MAQQPVPRYRLLLELDLQPGEPSQLTLNGVRKGTRARRVTMLLGLLMLNALQHAGKALPLQVPKMGPEPIAEELADTIAELKTTTPNAFEHIFENVDAVTIRDVIYSLRAFLRENFGRSCGRIILTGSSSRGYLLDASAEDLEVRVRNPAATL